ncbi:hypothetical protein J2TS4_06920 [Paenibacillus sp. J2TS4]|nr:hypothetical protein J2TS4_06920 [Paenibacillus sp. J2TS4]
MFLHLPAGARYSFSDGRGRFQHFPAPLSGLRTIRATRAYPNQAKQCDPAQDYPTAIHAGLHLPSI